MASQLICDVSHTLIPCWSILLGMWLAQSPLSSLINNGRDFTVDSNNKKKDKLWIGVGVGGIGDGLELIIVDMANTI